MILKRLHEIETLLLQRVDEAVEIGLSVITHGWLKLLSLKEDTTTPSTEVKMIPNYETKVEKLEFSVPALNKSVEIHVEMLVSVEKTIDLLFQHYETTGETKHLEELAPYFGTVWPSALALTEFMANSFQEEWLSKQFLEIGCGLALPSLFLAKLDVSASATDFHPDVERFMQANISRNRISSLKYERQDWRKANSKWPQDFILASDVLYDRDQIYSLSKALFSNMRAGATALVADPGRSYLQDFVNECRKLDLKCDEFIVDRNIFLIRVIKLESV